MELEKEIASTKFESNHHKAVINLLYTYGWVTNLLRKQFDKYQLTMQQYNILRILRGQHPQPATINLLKERMLDKMSDASRIVERLVQKGLVSRCTNERDRRAVDIMINDKGLEILKTLDLELNINNILKNNLSDEEAVQLNILLDKMRG
jgi:DNA-binding MarR family transcriptional regulator